MLLLGKSRRGFTVTELITVIAIVLGFVLLVGFLLPAMTRRPHGGRYLRDATQVRNVAQAMLIWADQNQGQFPPPSAVDKDDATVSAHGRAKDTSANIISLLIWNAAISPEICVSPAEANSSIAIMDTYENAAPATAVDPQHALWDPAFSADFTNGCKGNLSYAMLETSGDTRSGRRALWQNTSGPLAPLTPIVANRGPRITAIDRSTGKPVVADSNTNTYLIHGGRRTWEGNVAYGDGHVNFETSLMDSAGGSSTSAGGKKFLDCVFFDEPEDSTASNIFLGIFTAAGEKPSDFVAIFD